MTPKDPRLHIGPYLSGELPEEERRAFEREVAIDSELRVELGEMQALWEELGRMPQAEPSPELRARFYRSLHAPARNANAGKKSWHIPVWAQAAAAVGLFAAGLYLGQAGRARRESDDEMAHMRTQVQSLREMVALSLLDRQSAVSRLQGVSWSSRVDRPDNELLTALLSALNGDPNVNVRLSSVDALERYTHDVSVRKALVEAIGRQESPLVQIALIDTLVQVRDRSATDEFKRLSAAANVNGAVRQRAHWALVRLNEPDGNGERP